MELEARVLRLMQEGLRPPNALALRLESIFLLTCLALFVECLVELAFHLDPFRASCLLVGVLGSAVAAQYATLCAVRL